MSEVSISSVIAGSIVTGVGWIWIVITAFRESKFQGLFCLLPLYAMYYGIRRWSDAKESLLIASVGFVILIVGIVYGLPRKEMEVRYICTDMTTSQVVETVIAEFMEAGVERNIEAAYAYWSPESASEEDIAGYIESNYDDLFAGYERLAGQSTTCWASGDESIDHCEVEGPIVYSYNGGKTLLFEAWMVKENEVWNITAIRIGCVEAGIMCEGNLEAWVRLPI